MISNRLLLFNYSFCSELAIQRYQNLSLGAIDCAILFLPKRKQHPKMKCLLAFGVLSGLLTSQPLGQDATGATFHTTSVRSADATDYCSTGKCQAKRFTVEGYIDVKGSSTAVEYDLECVEILATEPDPHITVACIRVHAHEDYLVKLGPDYISFSDAQRSKGGPIISAYAIVSEKEAARHRQ
jgi:hypothetical protein